MNDQKKASQLLSPTQVGELLGVCRQTVYKYYHTGKIPQPCKFGLGRRLKWIRPEVEKWILGGCEPIPLQTSRRKK